MNSKHLVGGIGMTTTREQVTVIVYPYRLPKRLKPLTECILETQKNFGKVAIGTVLLLCIDPKAKFELVSRNGLRVVIVPPNHPLFRETLETMPRLCGFVHLVYAALHDLASGVAPAKVFAYAVNQCPNDYREWSKGIGDEADEVLAYIITELSSAPKFYHQFAVFAD